MPKICPLSVVVYKFTIHLEEKQQNLRVHLFTSHRKRGAVYVGGLSKFQGCPYSCWNYTQHPIIYLFSNASTISVHSGWKLCRRSFVYVELEVFLLFKLKKKIIIISTGSDQFSQDSKQHKKPWLEFLSLHAWGKHGQNTDI